MNKGSRATGRRVLVVGMGIAGIAAALRLEKAGWDPVIVERAPERRNGGYFIALFGVGVGPAERLGILDAIPDRAHPETVTLEIDRDGGRRRGMGFTDLPKPVRPRVMMRGDVERALYEALPESVEVRFSTVPTKISEEPDRVDVTLNDTEAGTTSTESFDLVVGADGLRSTVRRLVFGPHEKFLKSLNHIIVAYQLSKPVTGFNHHDGIALTEPGLSASVFPFADKEPTAMLSYRNADIDGQFRIPPGEALRKAFGPKPLGPVLEELFTEFENTEDRLFDSAHQAVMPTWHTDRVALVGDAAYCPTLYTGMGASSGLAGADLLGTELERHPDNITLALNQWEARLRPFSQYIQRNISKDLPMFVPQSRAQKVMRNGLLQIAHTPVIGDLVWLQKQHSRRLQAKTRDIAA